ncbi:exonuclease domain-containing protein [Algoriphagus sp. Y33]|uniref:exonuclease domain-containing protein n=1 Tax=Algoriphagus sp. Y33 TaxID=2772483 RepID=UPI00178501F1|nr:exonuclease domain-containing protein [Algoriphagus sp. Y33]
MDNHFFVIDVETANLDNSSICQIGLAEFQDTTLISTWESLVNPDQFFDPYLSKIHGITADQVLKSPRFSDLSGHIAKKTKGKRLFHHMPFDKNAINRACERHNALRWEAKWMDSARLVRRAWREFAHTGYALGKITKHLGIKYQAHHALYDAIATGQVINAAILHSAIPLSEWDERILQSINSFQSSGKAANYKMQGNPNGLLYGESVVFTGTLSQPRSMYAQFASEAGCRVQDGITKETTILVVGWQDSYRLAGYEKSSKHRRAEKLAEAGHGIRILSEEDFLAITAE